MPVSDAAFGQVVRRKLKRDPVACKNADSIPAQFAGEVCQHDPILIELYAELTGGKFLNYCACNFNAIFLAHFPPRSGFSISLSITQQISALSSEASALTNRLLLTTSSLSDNTDGL